MSTTRRAIAKDWVLRSAGYRPRRVLLTLFSSSAETDQTKLSPVPATLSAACVDGQKLYAILRFQRSVWRPIRSVLSARPKRILFGQGRNHHTRQAVMWRAVPGYRGSSTVSTPRGITSTRRRAAATWLDSRVFSGIEFAVWFGVMNRSRTLAFLAQFRSH
jgi:hypothetical protein